MRADTTLRSVVVRPAAATLRRALDSTSWVVLEELLAHSTGDGDDTVVVASVRSIAAALGIAKDTAARALTRLRAVGLIEPMQDRSTAGTFAAASYRLTVPADILAVGSVVGSCVMRQSPRTSPAPSSQLSLLDG